MNEPGGRDGPTEQPDGRCPVCGSELKPDEGVDAEWRGRTLRFRCLGCLARFEADPDRYLAGHTDQCGADEWEETTRATTYVEAITAWHAIANGSLPGQLAGDSGDRAPSAGSQANTLEGGAKRSRCRSAATRIVEAL